MRNNRQTRIGVQITAFILYLLEDLPSFGCCREIEGFFACPEKIMAHTYQSYASTSHSKIDNAYILSLVATFGNGLAAITSSDELFVVDRQNLASAQTVLFKDTPTGISCLVSGDVQGQSLICSGTDGVIATYDLRSQSRISQFKIGMFHIRRIA